MNGFFNKARYIKIIIVLALIWSAISTTPAHALEGCYVNVNATGNNTGGNWANAYTSLQSAIADSVCTEIWVAAGTYKPHASDRAISFNLENDLSIYGGFVGTETLRSQRNPAANLTILSGDIDNNDTNTDGNNIAETVADIQGDNSYHVVIGSSTNSTAILDGFTITAGKANGSALNSNGGGMYNDSGSPTIRNTTFSGNSATNGGGMYNTNTSNPTVSNVTFSGNSASSNGGGMYNSVSFPTISNSTFSNNSASAGGGMLNELASNPAINNSTFSNNNATTGGGIFNDNSSSPTLKNTIIANSTGGDCRNANSSTISSASSHNLIESTGTDACDITTGFGGGSNIIGSDPALGTLTGSPAYFPLNTSSPALNAGTNTGCPATDTRGVARPQGINCDIGAFEFIEGMLYAKPSATGTASCLSWANACTLQTAISLATDGNGIWVMQGTHKPHVSDRNISFTLKSGVAIYGGFAGTETLLSQRNPATNITILSGDLNGDDSGFTNNGENSYHVVTSTGVTNTAILDGFTISNGNANGADPNDTGSGMYNTSSSPTITNTTFSGNSSTGGGGGMYNYNNSNPSLTNVTFSGNSASNGPGGGMLNYINSNPSLTNVTFSGNSAPNGGGVSNIDNSSPNLTNVTFSSNSANYGGGMYTLGGSPSLTNVTFSGNSANTSGGGMYNNGASPILKNVVIANSTSGGECVLANSGLINAASSHNLIESTGTNACNLTANSGGGGNIIGSDPTLGSLTGSPAYFPLNTGSPAINAGTNTGCPATDQRGTARPQGSLCDIGSYELGATVRAILPSNGAQDGWVRESTETSEVGGTVDASASVLIVGDDAADRQYRSVLSFDTSSLPDTAVITQATLAIRVNEILGSGNPLRMFNYFMIDVANGSFGTSALAAQDFQASPTVSAGPLGQTNTGGGWLYIDLKTAKSGINPTGLTQLRLRYSLGDNDNGIENILKFYSGNYATVKHRPQLNVWYSLP